MSASYWPFAQNPAFSIPQVINYDLIIQEPFPGIDFVPTVAGGLYSEIRDVYNCTWFVQNAMWNPNNLQWEQDTPANCVLPAYALELCADGSLSYNIAPATGAINTPVAWQTVWKLDANGNMTVEPATATLESQVAEAVNPTWNGGVDAIMVGRQENVTDTSSATASSIDQLNVNGATKWEVRKDGTLVIGIIPASLIPGVIDEIVGIAPVSVAAAGHIATISLSHGDYVDLASAQTITGVKTFTDAAGILFGSTTGSEGSISGNATAQAMGYGAKFSVAPFTWQAEAVQAVIIALSTANDAENPDGFAMYYDSGLTVGDTYAPTLVFAINSAGKITTGSISASELAAEMEGTDGITVSYDGGTQKVDVSGIGLIATITSSNASILATLSPAQTYDLTVAGGAAAAFDSTSFSSGTLPITLSFVLPAGGTYNIQAFATGWAWNSDTDPGTVTFTASSGVTGFTQSPSQSSSQNTGLLLGIGSAAGGTTVSVTLGGSYTKSIGNGIFTLQAVKSSN